MVASNSRLVLRAGLAGLALTASVALVGAGAAGAEPATPNLPGTSTLDSLAVPGSPLDSQLAEALRTLKQSGADQKALEAVKAILESQGQLDPKSLLPGSSDEPGTPSPAPAPANPTAPDVPAVPTSQVAAPAASPAATDPSAALDALQKATGAQVLTPALAPFCAAPTTDNPLGLVSAPAVAFPGPFPKVGDESVPDLLSSLNLGFLNDLLANNQDTKELTQMLRADHTAFAIVPPADSTSSQFQVAWFNTETMKGNLEPLKPLNEISDSKALQTLLSTAKTPLRLARVDTGHGSILTAIFGTTTTAGHTCYFLPAIGIVDNPAS